MPEAIRGARQKKKKGLLKGIIALTIVVLIGGGLYINRSKIAPIVKNIPILNQIFKTEIGTQDPYDMLSKEELKQKLLTTEEVLANEQLKVVNLENETTLLNDKINALKQYEENYNAFIAQKNEWDKKVAEENPELFKEQFEATYKDTAELIYRELKGEEILNKEQKEVAKTIGQMSAKEAAAALTKLLSTDTELVKNILKNMKSDQQAKILNEMSATTAAQVIKLIAPSQN
ncbi:MotE family protein [Niameybacter massiliensis]|uniref:hypothetical protein n=1 Tax=Niameybacter massiliensis TaxID=1658108 RepID=UPI0006B5707C|nr:hypothetical protein [Niameybacter massiliensis]